MLHHYTQRIQRPYTLATLHRYTSVLPRSTPVAPRLIASMPAEIDTSGEYTQTRWQKRQRMAPILPYTGESQHRTRSRPSGVCRTESQDAAAREISTLAKNAALFKTLDYHHNSRHSSHPLQCGLWFVAPFTHRKTVTTRKHSLVEEHTRQQIRPRTSKP